MVTTDAMSDLELARKVLRIEAEAILGLVDRLDERVRRRAVDAAARLPRARHPDRHGQVGHHLPEDRRDALEHRHAGVLPAPRRGDPRRPRRAPGATTCVVALSYSGETEELLRLLETIRASARS